MVGPDSQSKFEELLDNVSLKYNVSIDDVEK